MSSLANLNQQIAELFHSQLKQISVSDLNMSLWLLDPPSSQDFSPAQVDAIWSDMPYWAFVWSSGRALAKYLIDNPHLVKDKVIADFGAGSGVVALAALKAGAKQAIVVDIDEAALLACQENARLNQCEVTVVKTFEEAMDAEVILVGDVLYDPRNHGLAEQLFNQEKALIWAESQAQTRLSQYGPVASIEGETLPNIGGFDEHKTIHIYHHGL